ncbi:transglutaminaseTgpA domain-containing protein [Neisseria sp. CCUG12390]|uniref:transglutaminase family protein n=1 Tax=Neisseria sp. CCUG12390 TaxID=3392035 RepID=UPI003A10359A
MLSAAPAFLPSAAPPRTAIVILAALLFAALPMIFSLPPAVTLLFAALLVFRGALLYAGIGKLPAPVLALLVAVSGGLVWSQLGTVFGREGGIAFLLLMVTLKAFESTTRRDWNVLLLAMLFLIGSSVLLNQSLLTGLWLLAALFAVSACFAVLGGLNLRESWRSSAAALLMTLPLAAVLFVSVPRLNEPLWGIPQKRDNQASTGLSDTMQPGSISNLVQSDEWVANVIFSDGLTVEPKNLYWRAIIMDEFDGRTWRAAPDFARDNAQNVSDGPIVGYQMIIRDQNGALPVLDYPAGEPPQGLSRRLGNTLRAERSREGLRRLNLRARISDTLPHALNEAEYRRYTRLPQANPRTLALSQTLAKNAPTEREFIRNTLDYFRRQGFSYTLQPRLLSSSHTVDEFLFQSKQGFCEHYAQSFAVIMRAAGLPARIVTGYLGAEYNEQAGFWQIRSKDAHAWTEVWLPSEQVWLRIDPTAAVSSVRTEQGISQALPQDEQSLLPSDNLFSRWRDTGQFYFQQWVVNYDQSRQNSLFEKIGLGGFNLKSLLLFLPVALALALLPLLRWWLKNRRRDELQEGFMLLKRAVLGEDDDTAPAVTPSELCDILRRNQADDPAVDSLLACYENWLYAGETVGRRGKKRWFRAVKKAARRYK